MNREQEAIKILELVLNGTSEKINNLSASNEQRHFFTVPGQGNLRWIIPDDPRLGIPVLSQWRPYKPWSCIKWKFILLLYSARLLKKLPGIGTLKLNPDKICIHNDKSRQKMVPVVYVGTPGPHQKIVATFMNPVSAMPVNVMKLALKKTARENIIREAEMLKKMAVLNHPGIPKLISIENKGAKTVQTVINGYLTSRKLTNAHIDWLLKLPRFETTTTIDEQKQIIQELITINRHSHLSEMERTSVIRAAATLQGKKPIPYLIIHGDFAPWNLKWLAKDKITAIDWEDSHEDGLPLWDLSHFFCIQSHLFGGPDPFKKLNNCPLVTLYIKKMDLNHNDIRPLYILYLIKKIMSSTLLPIHSYRVFLLNQIHRISQQ